MFKKFFSSWAQASENKRRANFLRGLEEFTQQNDIQNVDHLVELVGLLAMAKQNFDSFDALHDYGEKHDIDFDPLGEAVCNAARQQIAALGKLSNELPGVFAKADASLLDQHLKKESDCLQAVHSAFAALQRAAGQKVSEPVQRLSEDCDSTSPVGRAIESLLLQVRTFERIRTELGS